MNPMRALRQYQKVNSHAQISEASPHRLVQMLMEGGLDRMAQAKGRAGAWRYRSEGPDARQGYLTSSLAFVMAWTRKKATTRNTSSNWTVYMSI